MTLIVSKLPVAPNPVNHSREWSFIKSKAIVEADRAGVSFHHVNGFPSSQVSNSQSIDSSLPQQAGEGPPEGVRIARQVRFLLQSSQHRLDTTFVDAPDVTGRVVPADPVSEIPLA